jgi:hypothetical protein
VLAAQVPALSRCEAVLHHDAVEVIGLVLQAPSERARARDPDRLSELVLATDDRHVRPSDR